MGLERDLFTRPDWLTFPMPPMGLISIAGFLRANGHEVSVIDCREIIKTHRTSDYVPILVQTVKDFKPDLMGISILTPHFNEALRISAGLKEQLPQCLLIAGGPHPSVEPVLTLEQNPYLDAVCIGAGEEVCLDVMDGKAINNVKGLMRRDHMNDFETRAVNHDLDRYPFPDFSTFNTDFYTSLSLSVFWWVHKTLWITTSRGCPYSCKFCATDWSKPFRYHSPEYVIDLVRHVSTLDIDTITFGDDTIAVPRQRLEKICEGFIDSRLFWPNRPLRWCAGIRADQVNPDILNLMRKAGCFLVHIGVESGSDRMLKAIDKKTTAEINRRACSYVTDAGLNLSTSYIIGLPGETEKEMLETLAFMKETEANNKVFLPFLPLPGSPFYYGLIETNQLSKEKMDWSKLGDFSRVPDQLFCDVPRERFTEILADATKIAHFESRFITAHEEILSKYPETLAAIAENGTWKMKICRSGGHGLPEHIPFQEFLRTVPELVPFLRNRNIESPWWAKYRILRFLGYIVRRAKNLLTVC
jgi:radical SAM superfamily enzyme YgiQ (UPF0313 family)